MKLGGPTSGHLSLWCLEKAAIESIERRPAFQHGTPMMESLAEETPTPATYGPVSSGTSEVSDEVPGAHAGLAMPMTEVPQLQTPMSWHPDQHGYNSGLQQLPEAHSYQMEQLPESNYHFHQVPEGSMDSHYSGYDNNQEPFYGQQPGLTSENAGGMPVYEDGFQAVELNSSQLQFKDTDVGGYHDPRLGLWMPSASVGSESNAGDDVLCGQPDVPFAMANDDYVPSTGTRISELSGIICDGGVRHETVNALSTHSDNEAWRTLNVQLNQVPSMASGGTGLENTGTLDTSIAELRGIIGHTMHNEDCVGSLSDAADAEVWKHLHAQLQSLHQNVQDFANKRCPSQSAIKSTATLPAAAVACAPAADANPRPDDFVAASLHASTLSMHGGNGTPMHQYPSYCPAPQVAELGGPCAPQFQSSHPSGCGAFQQHPPPITRHSTGHLFQDPASGTGSVVLGPSSGWSSQDGRHAPSVGRARPVMQVAPPPLSLPVNPREPQQVATPTAPPPHSMTPRGQPQVLVTPRMHGMSPMQHPMYAAANGMAKPCRAQSPVAGMSPEGYPGPMAPRPQMMMGRALSPPVARPQMMMARAQSPTLVRPQMAPQVQRQRSGPIGTHGPARAPPRQAC